MRRARSAAPASEGAASRRRSGAVLSYAYTIAQAAVNLLYVPLLLSGIGSSEYGLYQLIGSIMAYMSIMGTTFAAGTTRFYCKYHAEGDERQMENTLAICRRIYLVMSIVAVAVGAAAAALVRVAYAHVLTDFQLMESTLMLAVLVANLIVTMNNTISVAVINAHERFAFLKATQLAVVVMQPVVVLAAISQWPYAAVVPCAQLAMNALCAVAQRLFARNVLGAKVVLHGKDRRLLRSLLAFSTAIVAVMVADQLFWKSNQLILGYYFGTESVAVYSVGYQITMVYMSLGLAIPAVFMPRVTELFVGGDMGAISRLFAKVGRLTLYPLLLVLTGFVAFGQDFIRLWAGEGYADAYLVALALMGPFTVDLSQNLGLTIMQVMDKYYFRGKMYLAMAAVNVVVVLAAAPYVGSVGAAACSGLFMLLGNGVASNVYYSRAVGLDVPGFWRAVLGEALPALALGAAAALLSAFVLPGIDTWGAMVLALAAYTAAFCLVMWLFACDDYEKRLAMSALGKVRSAVFRKRKGS